MKQRYSGSRTRLPRLMTIALTVFALIGITGPATAAETAATSDSRTYDVQAVAGFETGLVSLAFIDDRLAAGRNVSVDFGGTPVLQTAPAEGLTYHCEGVLQRKQCTVYGTVAYNNPGVYAYTVTYLPSGRGASPITLTGGRVIVEPAGDFVVVSIGDSVASGEGDPQKPLGLFDGAYWNDVWSNPNDLGVNDGDGCHRSSWAGPSIAARQIKSTNPGITFIHIACSGASLNGSNPDKTSLEYRVGSLSEVNHQLMKVREHVDRIDVLIISAGANNVSGGFGAVVTTCVLNNPVKPCSEDIEFINELQCSITGVTDVPGTTCPDGTQHDGLAPDYALLDALIDQRGIYENGSDPDESPSVVLITEYFDPTRDDAGNFPSIGRSVSCGLGAVGPKEWEFLYNEMVVPLNEAVETAATTHGWVYVGGIADAFRTHGYCASHGPGDNLGGDSWVVKFPESLLNQGDEAGTAHPDLNGQGVYADHIYDALIRANPPRTTATATTEGRPYTFGTWVNTDVEVTLSAHNPINESAVGSTHYAADEPLCTYESPAGDCTPYDSPFMVTESGRNTVSFYSTNVYGAPETNAEPVEVLIDREPPVMSCSASPEELWAPNNRFIDVAAAVTAVDEVSGPADFWLDAIADSYGDAGTAIQGFELGEADTDGSMLAKRSGRLGTRVYTLTYASADHLGNTGTCEVAVSVPHDQRRRSSLS